MPGYKGNITDGYDRERLARVQEAIQHSGKPGIFNGYFHKQYEESARQQTISMRDAVELSKDFSYQKRIDLSEDQKRLIAAVAEERKTESGRYLTDEAAKNGLWLAVDNNVPNDSAGWHSGSDKLMTVQLTNKKINADLRYDAKSVQETLHHELVHSDQSTSGRCKTPEGLSSYDKRLWRLGHEGQAFVAEENENRIRAGKPPLTYKERQELFSKNVSENFYSNHYEIGNSTRADGRRLTKEEFANAFGTVPGEKDGGNFLRNGDYKDPADLFKSRYYDVHGKEQSLHHKNPDGRNPFDRARYEAEQKPLKYDELPSAGGKTRRYETLDKSLVVCITKQEGTDNSKVEVYRLKDLPGGSRYVKGHEREATYMRPSYREDGSFIGYNASYVMRFPEGNGQAKSVVVFLAKDKDPRVTGYDQDVKDIRFEEKKPLSATPSIALPHNNLVASSQTPIAPAISSSSTNDWLGNWSSEVRGLPPLGLLKETFTMAVQASAAVVPVKEVEARVEAVNQRAQNFDVAKLT